MVIRILFFVVKKIPGQAQPVRLTRFAGLRLSRT
jgi:hypothetical protein